MKGIDTNILIDAANNDEKATETLKSIKELAVADLVAYEYLKGKLSATEERAFSGLLAQVRNVPFTTASAKRAAHIFREHQRKGKTKPAIDTAIAASYLAAGVDTIVTRNPKDYEGIEGLNVETY